MRGVDTVHLLSAILTDRTNALGADFRKVWCHGEFSRIDGMEAAIRSDTDLESTMQFACGIVNISFAPGNDRAAFDIELREGFQRPDREAKARSRKERGKCP